MDSHYLEDTGKFFLDSQFCFGACCLYLEFPLFTFLETFEVGSFVFFIVKSVSDHRGRVSLVPHHRKVLLTPLTLYYAFGRLRTISVHFFLIQFPSYAFVE